MTPRDSTRTSFFPKAFGDIHFSEQNTAIDVGSKLPYRLMYSVVLPKDGLRLQNTLVLSIQFYISIITLHITIT